MLKLMASRLNDYHQNIAQDLRESLLPPTFYTRINLLYSDRLSDSFG